MDGKSFDTLARAVGGVRSRRGVAAGLAALIGGLGGGAAAQVEPKRVECFGPCRRNSDCNAGLRCRRPGAGDGECVLIPNSRDRCRADRDCPRSWEACIDFRCRSVKECPQRCSGDGDCRRDEVCVANRCVDDDTNRCDRDRDCPRNKRCRRGRCRRDRG